MASVAVSGIIPAEGARHAAGAPSLGRRVMREEVRLDHVASAANQPAFSFPAASAIIQIHGCEVDDKSCKCHPIVLGCGM
jgi:hypothetical protein